MDKVAYHFNKKKLRAKTDGKFLYYYPCNEEDKANTFLYGKGYFVIEVTEKEWEALFELDRFEYNNWHKVYRHNESFPENEERLSPTEQQKWINRDVPLAVTTAERIDRICALSTLTKREREVYCMSVDEQCKQEDIAEELGITQGAVSSTFRRARRKLDAYNLSKDNTPADIVWKLWQIFMRDFELPDFLDVEIEFVIRKLFGDMLPFINWFYSIGELCRYILRYYIFDEDKIDPDTQKYLSTATDIEKKHFEEQYGDTAPIVRGVYVRLCMEVKSRERNGLHDSHKAIESIYTAIEKLAKPLKKTVEQCLTERLYPFVAERRNKRLRQFYEYYSSKKLPH